jgi:hypothetical protein
MQLAPVARVMDGWPKDDVAKHRRHALRVGAEERKLAEPDVAALLGGGHGPLALEGIAHRTLGRGGIGQARWWVLVRIRARGDQARGGRRVIDQVLQRDVPAEGVSEQGPGAQLQRLDQSLDGARVATQGPVGAIAVGGAAVTRQVDEQQAVAGGGEHFRARQEDGAVQARPRMQHHHRIARPQVTHEQPRDLRHRTPRYRRARPTAHGGRSRGR